MKKKKKRREKGRDEDVFDGEKERVEEKWRSRRSRKAEDVGPGTDC